MKKTGVKILVVKICFLFAGPAFLAGPKMGFCFGSSRAMAINATVDRSPVYIGKNAVGISPSIVVSSQVGNGVLKPWLHRGVHVKFEDEYEMAGKQIDVKQGIKHGVPTKHAVVTKHGHHFPVCRNSTASEFSTFSTSPESVSSFLQLKKKTPSRKESLTDYIQNLRDKLYACSSEHSSEVILYNSETSCAQYSQSGTAQSAYQGSEEDHQADSEEDSESPIAKTLCGMPLDALCGPRHDFQPLRDEIGPEMRRVQKVAFAHYTLGENKAAKLIHALTFHSKASSLRFNDCRITACLGFNALGKALSQTPIKHLIIEQEPYLGENGVAKIIEEVLLADCDNGGKSDGNKNNGNIIESLTFIDVGLKLFHDDMNALDPDRQLRRAFMEVSDLRGVGPFEKRPLRIIFASSEEYIFNVASIKALIERTKWRVSERVSDEMTQSAGGKTYRSLQFHLSDREGDCE